MLEPHGRNFRRYDPRGSGAHLALVIMALGACRLAQEEDLVCLCSLRAIQELFQTLDVVLNHLARFLGFLAHVFAWPGPPNLLAESGVLRHMPVGEGAPQKVADVVRL